MCSVLKPNQSKRRAGSSSVSKVLMWVLKLSSNTHSVSRIYCTRSRTISPLSSPIFYHTGPAGKPTNFFYNLAQSCAWSITDTKKNFGERNKCSTSHLFGISIFLYLPVYQNCNTKFQKLVNMNLILNTIPCPHEIIINENRQNVLLQNQSFSVWHYLWEMDYHTDHFKHNLNFIFLLYTNISNDSIQLTTC
jgi:hypothetical protein